MTQPPARHDERALTLTGDVPGLIDMRPLDEQFAELDRLLTQPRNLSRRLAGHRARQRDRCRPSVRERVTWIGLWQQLEDINDNSEPDDGVTV